MRIRPTQDLHNSRTAPPPDYLSRRLQRRLLTLVGMLLLVLILMQQARRPARWTWLWRMTDGTPASDPSSFPSPSATLSNSTPLAAATHSGWLPGIDASTLRDVRDDSYFRPAERTAWFTLWRVLDETPSDQLEACSLGEVSYLQIYRQTPTYRGRLVDLQGTIRRAHRVNAPHNDAGIEQYLQCWLFMDVGPREPIIIYVLNPPRTLPEGMTLSEPVRLTGIVYKRWSYQSTNQLTVAPVVLAKDLKMLAPLSFPTDELKPAPIAVNPWLATGATALLSLAIVAMLFRHTSRRYRRSHPIEALPATIAPPPLDLSVPNSSPNSSFSRPDRPDDDAPP